MDKKYILENAIVTNMGLSKEDSNLTLFDVHLDDKKYRYGIGISLKTGLSRVDGMNDEEQSKLVLEENAEDILNKQ